MDKDTLYYDGACPLCSAEIGKLEKYTSDELIIRDIHEPGADESGTISLSDGPLLAYAGASQRPPAMITTIPRQG